MTDSYKMFSDPNLLAKIAGSPQTKHLLSDPSFMAKLHQVQQNPQLLQTEVLQDQRLMQVMVMLLGINMSAPPEGGEPMQTDEPVSPIRKKLTFIAPRNVSAAITTQAKGARKETRAGSSCISRKSCCGRRKE